MIIEECQQLWCQYENKSIKYGSGVITWPRRSELCILYTIHILCIKYFKKYIRILKIKILNNTFKKLSSITIRSHSYTVSVKHIYTPCRFLSSSAGVEFCLDRVGLETVWLEGRESFWSNCLWALLVDDCGALIILLVDVLGNGVATGLGSSEMLRRLCTFAALCVRRSSSTVATRSLRAWSALQNLKPAFLYRDLQNINQNE